MGRSCVRKYLFSHDSHLFIKSVQRMTTHSNRMASVANGKIISKTEIVVLRSPFVWRTRTIDPTIRWDEDNNLAHSTMSQSTYYFPIEQTLCARRRAKQRPQCERLRTIKHPIKTHSQPPYAFTPSSHPQQCEWNETTSANTFNDSPFILLFILHIALRYCVLAVINGTSHMCKHRASSDCVLIFILTQPNDLINYFCAARQIHFHSLIQINNCWSVALMTSSSSRIVVVRPTESENQIKWMKIERVLTDAVSSKRRPNESISIRIA